jgi:hypothetical protein
MAGKQRNDAEMLLTANQERVLRLHEQGKTTVEIAADLGVTRQRAHALQQKLGLTVNSKGTKTAIIQDLYESGQRSASEIAAKAKASPGFVRVVLEGRLQPVQRPESMFNNPSWRCRTCKEIKPAKSFPWKKTTCLRCWAKYLKERRAEQVKEDLAHPNRKRKCSRCGAEKKVKDFRPSWRRCRVCARLLEKNAKEANM